MADIAKAYVQIIPSTEGIKGKLTEALGGEADSAGEAAGSSITSKIVGTMAKLGIGAAIGKTIKDSLEQGANLEQSIGGVETLFKNSAAKVIKNANDAWKTAGISANDYMEQATSFSASLLQSLGGDTAKAAEYADMAIKDMSDNANKMGTDIGSIQNAYQGFAKNNYTMLDNLKLGYGGTKEEMQRLLEDASKLSGVDYNIDNLNDVYEAIHVIQQEMEITGTTAKEGSETLSGSMAQMGAAWENLLGAMATGSQFRIQESMRNMIESAQIMLFDNLLPMIGNIVASIPDLLIGIFPQLTEPIEMFRTLAGEAIEFVIGLFGMFSESATNDGGIVNGIIQTIQEYIGVLGEYWGAIVQGLVDTFNWFMEQATTDGTVINAVVEAIQLVFQTAGEYIGLAIDGIIGFIHNLTTENESGQSTISIVWGMIQQVIETVAAAVHLVIEGIISIFKDTGVTTEDMGRAIDTVFKGIQSLIETTCGAITLVLETLEQLLTGDFSGAFDTAKESIGTAIDDICKFFTGGDGLMDVWNNVMEKVNEVYESVTGKWQEIKDFFDGIVEEIKGLMDFDWSFPTPRMPHFSVTWDDWGPFSIPDIDIEWYAKAMDTGYMFTSPTVLGNKGFGDAGAEMVIGRDSMMGMISDAQNDGMEKVVYTLERMIDIFSDYFPEFAKNPVISPDDIVEATAEPMKKRIDEIAYLGGW